MGVEDSGKPRKGRGKNKDKQLVAGDVHAHGLGRALGGVQGAQRPPDAAVQEVEGQPDEKAQDHGHEAVQGHVLAQFPAEQRQARYAHEA